MKQGTFVISLDFELHWGVFDLKTTDEYRTNLDNTRTAIDRIIDLCERYDVKITFATVGLLFGKSKEQLKEFLPDSRPDYTNTKLNAYPLISSLEDRESQDVYHYAPSVIQKILENTDHEIGTHTFTHYYCVEDGQTKENFEADLSSAIAIANKAYDLPIRSIVFPRNQVNKQYLSICSEQGIVAYRGNEKARIFDPESKVPITIIRMLRLADSYINIFGHHTYDMSKLYDKENNIVNIPSSRFLRPFSNHLKAFEPLKLRRIKKAMGHAAKNGELYHLWWHPHNFGSNMDSNLQNLENIFQYFDQLRDSYGFQNETMHSLGLNIQNQSKELQF